MESPRYTDTSVSSCAIGEESSIRYPTRNIHTFKDLSLQYILASKTSTMGLLVFFSLLLYFTNDHICTCEKEEIVLADWGRIRTQANEVLDRCSTNQKFLCQQGNTTNVCSCKPDCRERGSCCIDHQGSEVAIRTGRSWSCLGVQTSLCHSHHLHMVSSSIITYQQRIGSNKFRFCRHFPGH